MNQVTTPGHGKQVSQVSGRSDGEVVEPTSRAWLYIRLMRLDKPIGILLLLWPTLWALWLASSGHPRVSWVVVFVMGSILTRSAGCVLNDIADRHIDIHVSRTALRPLAAGLLSVQQALCLAVILLLLAFVLAISYLPLIAVAWSVLAVFMMSSYPYVKRFFAVPQAYLGLTFGVGMLMAYAAERGEIPVEAWYLYVANVLWAVAYDTAYAMVDRVDDLKIGIRTSAITFGRYDVLAIVMCYIGMLAILVWLGLFIKMTYGYFFGLMLAACVIVRVIWQVRSRDEIRCFRAFLLNSWVGGCVFFGIVLDKPLAFFMRLA